VARCDNKTEVGFLPTTVKNMPKTMLAVIFTPIITITELAFSDRIWLLYE